MATGTRVSSVGVVTTNNTTGFEVAQASGNKGFVPYMVDSTTAFTTSSTVSVNDAGVCTVSGNVVHTLTMPLASACPNAEFVFRATSAHAHILTGSSTFVGTGSTGTRVTLNSTINSSVYLKSDGEAFYVLAFRNAPVINGS